MAIGTLVIHRLTLQDYFHLLYHIDYVVTISILYAGYNNYLGVTGCNVVGIHFSLRIHRPIENVLI